jgi:hypothetical protein
MTTKEKAGTIARRLKERLLPCARGSACGQQPPGGSTARLTSRTGRVQDRPDDGWRELLKQGSQPGMVLLVDDEPLPYWP